MFSQNALSLNSATEADSDTTESDLGAPNGSGPDDGGMRAVIRHLDFRLLSVLIGDLDLAAHLIPKVRGLLNGEAAASILNSSESSQDNSRSDEDDEGSNGKQRASGSSSSAPTNGNLPSNSSKRKHGRGSANSDEREEGKRSKTSRRGSERNSGDNPDQSPDPDSHGSPKDDATKDPSKDPDKSPDNPGWDPGGDPGDDPSLTLPLDPLPNFACPFYKLDPRKYGPWTDTKFEKCPGSRITELRRIK